MILNFFISILNATPCDACICWIHVTQDDSIWQLTTGQPNVSEFVEHQDGERCFAFIAIVIFSFYSFIWPSIVCRLDQRRRPGDKFLQKHILGTIFYQIWIKAQSMTWRTFQMVFEACDICNPVPVVLEVIWRFLEWKSKTLVQHLANITNWEM